VERGDPRQVLCAVSERVQPDLVVVGRGRHHLGTGPEHLGRVAGYVARHNPWPLAVIPRGARHRRPRIVLGVDGSAGSHVAVEWCARFAAPLGGTVIAVDVDESGAPAGTWQHDADHRAQIDAEIARSVAPLTAAGFDVERSSVLHQIPADALLHVAASRQADMVLVGTRGRGGFDELQVGGTALELLARARVPLVLVPRPRRHLGPAGDTDA
jgi:nucleotide-binding universal stress UspA family protein